MKIAFSSSGTTLDAALDQRFGRAPQFVIYDTEDKSCVSIDNTQNLEAAQGAGIQSAQNVAKTGATVLVTGHTGPKAFKVLQAAKVAIYLSAAATVQEALAAWEAGKLQVISEADVEGHWV